MLLAIVGPTAAGKTEVGILLAEALGGEIISADSMQVYRGMDIGTGKPSAEQLARVPHHLIDIVDPDQPFSVADYQARAQAALAQIRGRGRLPILVGGSGLYVRAVVDGLAFPMAPPAPELRRQLMEEARVNGLAALHARLVQVDPEAGQRIHPAMPSASSAPWRCKHRPAGPSLSCNRLTGSEERVTMPASGSSGCSCPGPSFTAASKSGWTRWSREAWSRKSGGWPAGDTAKDSCP